MKYFDQTWYDWTLDRIKELTDGKRNFTVYDVGAGNSVLEDGIRALGGTSTGFDYKPRKESVIELDLEKPIIPELTNGNPDIILLLEVIEHLFNPGLAMLNLAKMAKQGTHLILTTPNPHWSVTRLKFLFLNVFPMFEKSDLENNHHVFTAWPHVLEKLLTNTGFQIQGRFTVGHCAKFPRFSFDLSYPGKIIVFFLRKILEKFSPVSKGMCFGIIAIKQANLTINPELEEG